MENKSALTLDVVNRAIAAFEEKLLSSEIAAYIVKIIQFGSSVRGILSEYKKELFKKKM